jgi:hypothetical protein
MFLFHLNQLQHSAFPAKDYLLKVAMRSIGGLLKEMVNPISKKSEWISGSKGKGWEDIEGCL